MAMTTCKECKKEVSDSAKTCPHCGVKKPGERWWHALAGLAVMIVIGTGAYYYFGNDDTDKGTVKTESPKQCASTDGQCLFDKNLAEASYPCKKQIEKTSKYDFEWNDGVFGLAFTHFRNEPEKGQLVFTGDKVKFTNGFNAKVNMIYSCTYDLKTKSVVKVDVKEGRL
jgi:RNA polymerase subunit RPABC4/transcription elongation factor Spt4